MCAFSHDKTTDAHACVVSDLPVDDEKSAWAFGKFPKIDSAVANTAKVYSTDVKLSPLRYITGCAVAPACVNGDWFCHWEMAIIDPTE